MYPIIICYQKPEKQRGSVAKRLYPQTILIPGQICLESSSEHTHLCACTHTFLRLCHCCCSQRLVVPPQSLLPSPSSFSEAVSAGIPENLCDTGVGIRNLLRDSSPDSWWMVLLLPKFKKPRGTHSTLTGSQSKLNKAENWGYTAQLHVFWRLGFLLQLLIREKAFTGVFSFILLWDLYILCFVCFMEKKKAIHLLAVYC